MDMQQTCRVFRKINSVQVHPSGNLKAGKDYWVAQAAAGGTFSVTREANWEDATRATEGFLWMKEVSTSIHPAEQSVLGGAGVARPTTTVHNRFLHVDLFFTP